MIGATGAILAHIDDGLLIRADPTRRRGSGATILGSPAALVTERDLLAIFRHLHRPAEAFLNTLAQGIRRGGLAVGDE